MGTGARNDIPRVSGTPGGTGRLQRQAGSYARDAAQAPGVTHLKYRLVT